MLNRLPAKDVVVIGIGHTHAHVLRMWPMQAARMARLTCISDRPTATYSGMLPGVLAGLLPPERMTIDLVRLAAASGARLVVDETQAVDFDARQVSLAGRPPLSFDALSVGIGSVPALVPGAATSEAVVPIKPMQTFLARLDARLEAIAGRARRSGVRVAIVGGGDGGLEIAFCLPRYLRKTFGEGTVELLLIDGKAARAGSPLSARRRQIDAELAERAMTVLRGRTVERIDGEALAIDDGSVLEADLILWCGSAAAPPLLSRLDLPRDDRGFLEVEATLQTTAGLPVFAVGDSASIVTAPVAKAGVFAVREGPVLLDNLQRLLQARRLTRYRPQDDFLRLLNLGDGRALASWRNFAARSAWAWRLKSEIDGRFMDLHQDPEPPRMSAAPPAADTTPRCAGCGGKIGGSVLSAALRRLAELGSPALDPVLARAEDVVRVAPREGSAFAATTDFFTLPLDDPFLSGRIAALNAMSDAWAAGARPRQVLALAAVPEGPRRKQEDELFAMLAGAVLELERAGARLVGGHSIEAAQAMLGFTVLAEPRAGGLRGKGKLAAGDALILTKPLGTGVLLAAHMQARLEARWFESLVASMLVGNDRAAAVADRADLRSATDVTGFGLAGHLVEMLDASRVHAEIALERIALLAGVRELVGQGIESTLAPANRDAEARMILAKGLPTDARYHALFDPQTSGGLLLGCPGDAAPRLVEALVAAGVPEARIVGRVVKNAGDARPALRVVEAFP